MRYLLGASFFVFSEEWWGRIEPVLPRDLAPHARDARRFLEGYFRQSEGYPKDPKARAQEWRDVENCMRAAQQALKVAQPTEQWGHLLPTLARVEQDAALLANEFGRLILPTYKGKRVQGKRRPEREWLYNLLMEFWMFHGGELNCSRTGGVPSGPLVRFLVAALSGLPNPPNAYGVADIIERERKRRSRKSIKA